MVHAPPWVERRHSLQYAAAMYEPRPSLTYPPAWRVILAFLVCPLAAALLMALCEPAYEGLPTFTEQVIASAETYAILGAYPTTIIVAVPAYFMLRRHFEARPLTCALAGAIIAAIPWIFLIIVAAGASSASIDGRPTVVDGHYTLYGWLMNAWFVGQIALVGWAAGLLFWGIAAAGFQQRDIR